MVSKRKIKKGKKEKKPKLKLKQKQSQNVNIVIDQSKRSVKKSTPSQPQQFSRYLMPSANPNITVNIPDYLTRRNSLENYVVEPKKTFEKIGSNAPQTPQQNEFVNKRPNSILKERGFVLMSPITPFNDKEEEQDADYDTQAGIETVPLDLKDAEENVEEELKEEIEIEEAMKWVRSVEEDIQNYGTISPAQVRRYVKVLKDNGILSGIEFKDGRLTWEFNKPPDLKEAEEETEEDVELKEKELKQRKQAEAIVERERERLTEAKEWLKNVKTDILNYGKPSINKGKAYGKYLVEKGIISQNKLDELKTKWSENRPVTSKAKAGKMPKPITEKSASMKLLIEDDD